MITDPAKEVADFHNKSDVDSGDLAQHHTLGKKSYQAAPGDHQHKVEILSRTSVQGYNPVGLASPSNNNGVYQSLGNAILKDAQIIDIFSRGLAKSPGNCGCSWVMQYQINGGAWATLDVQDCNNAGDATTDLSFSLVASVDVTAVNDGGSTYGVRVNCSVAAGVSNLGLRSATFTLMQKRYNG